MTEYLKSNLAQGFNEPGHFVDFFSGTLFKDPVNDRGGATQVQNDIFLSISTDSKNPFSSSSYSYWPVIAMIANLPPWERFKIRNILPLLIIPGPFNPVDLVSFLEPLLDELEELSVAKMVQLWDGTVVRVRVHLLFILGDLPVLAKLCYLRGRNGRAPCRFCTIHGVYRGHVYFPMAVRVDIQPGNSGRRSVKKLWDPRRLPLRDEESLKRSLCDIREAELQGDINRAEALSKDLGVNSSTLTPLVSRMSFVRAFRSFPIDAMHLHYINVANHMVSLWTSVEPDLCDIAFLSDPKHMGKVERFLASAGSGISSTVRRPRTLSQRSSWKASEWKYFVHSTSMIALHDVIPQDALDGWWLFVQICELTSRWELSENDVERIGRLARRFFEHYSTKYYKMDPSRLKLCRYVYHLLLHIEQSIRDCGPVSLVAQWTMENYVGDCNQRCTANNPFAESVAANVRFQSAVRLYSLQQGLPIRHLDAVESKKSLRIYMRKATWIFTMATLSGT